MSFFPKRLSSENSGITLVEFERVFSTPEGLPPCMRKDHATNLVLGTTPVSVRSYHYPYLQKNKIENLVGEMFVDGIVQPSSSPFSSQVLLVRKKDGGLHFYVDYRL